MKNLITLILFFVGLSLSAQEVTCGNTHHPEFFQDLDERVLQSAPKSIDPYCNKLRVVVHVLYDGSQPETNEFSWSRGEISEAQVLSQIRSTNMAFRNDSLNFDSNNVALGYTLELAKFDPDGNPTNGINYYDMNPIWGTIYSNHGIRLDGSSGVSQSWVEDNIAWKDVSSNYLNIFVITKVDGGNGGGIQGWSYGASPFYTRHFCLANAFGDERLEDEYGETFPLKVYTDIGKTSIHEQGHDLALRHTFNNTFSCAEETNCLLQGDKVCDTPVEVLVGTGGCWSGCGVYNRNHMGYESQNCRVLFTQGQVDRMRSAIQNTLDDYLICEEPCIVDLENYGDFNEDGSIGIEDFSLFSAVYGVDSLYTPELDANCDGVIDIQDYSTFASNFGAEFFISHLRGDFDNNDLLNIDDKIDIYNHIGYDLEDGQFGVIYDLVIDGEINYADYDEFAEYYLPALEQCNLGSIGGWLQIPEETTMMKIYTGGGTNLFYEYNGQDTQVEISEPNLYYIKCTINGFDCGFKILVQ